MLTTQQQHLFTLLTANRDDPETIKQHIKEFKAACSEELNTDFLAFASAEWEFEIIEILINDFNISPNIMLEEGEDNARLLSSPLRLAVCKDTQNERQIKTVQMLLALGATLEDYSDEEVARIYKMAGNELPTRTPPVFLSNRIALLDIDDTLASTKGGQGRDGLDWFLNTEIVTALEKTGYRDIYFLTNYNPHHIPKTPEGWQSAAPSRLYLKQQLLARGFKVHGIIVPGDLLYRRGPGADYQDHIEPFEEMIMDKKSLKNGDEYVPDFFRITTNDSRRKNASRANNTKGLLFKYLINQVPELKGKEFVFIDDGIKYIREVNNAAIELGEKLTAIRCENTVVFGKPTTTLSEEVYIEKILGTKSLLLFATNKFSELQENHAFLTSSSSTTSISTSSTSTFFNHSLDLYREKASALCARTLYKLALLYQKKDADHYDLDNAKNFYRLAYILTNDVSQQCFIAREYRKIIETIHTNPTQTPANITEKDIRAFDIEQTCNAWSPPEKALFSYKYAEIYCEDLVYAVENGLRQRAPIQRILNLLANAWINGYSSEADEYKESFIALCKKVIAITPVVNELFNEIKQNRIEHDPHSKDFFESFAELLPVVAREKSAGCIIS